MGTICSATKDEIGRAETYANVQEQRDVLELFKLVEGIHLGTLGMAEGYIIANRLLVNMPTRR